MEGFTIKILSFLSLTTISIFSYILSQRIKVPYTLFLVFVGSILAILAKIGILEYLGEFKLTPELLFYVFLPTLLFEAGYNIKINNFLKSIKAIFSLAVVGLLISTLVIGFGLSWVLSFFGIDIPIIVSLLFGAIISATDPVAVIALFKEYAAPKRLTLLFEGESLFNDGTAVAMFMVILGVILESNGVLSWSAVFSGLGIFLSMIGLGLFFGSFMGVIFSKLLDYAKNENLQITLMLLVAHLTFLISEILTEEYHIYISGIVATIAASLIMGNYGRYKLTPRVEKYVDSFWEYFAFVANSLVFLLLGFLLTEIDFLNPEIILISVLAIFVVMVARAISVFTSLYWLKWQSSEKTVPFEWQILLSWGSLRGALAITMVLMIPDNLNFSGWNYSISIKEFVTVIVVASIYFTLFVKGLSIGWLIKKLKIGKIGEYERMEYLEGKAYMYFYLKKFLKNEKENGNLSEDKFKIKLNEVSDKIKKIKQEMMDYAKNHPDFLNKSLIKYSIGIEKKVLEDLYSKNEITEKAYKKFLNKLEKQEENIENGYNGILSFENIIHKGLIDNLFSKFRKKSNKEYLDNHDKYLYYNALILTAAEVVKALEKISGEDGIFEKKDIKEILDKYQEFYHKAKIKMEKMLNDKKIKKEKNILSNLRLVSAEKDVLKIIQENNLITEKIRLLLEKEVDLENEKFNN